MNCCNRLTNWVSSCVSYPDPKKPEDIDRILEQAKGKWCYWPRERAYYTGLIHRRLKHIEDNNGTHTEAKKVYNYIFYLDLYTPGKAPWYLDQKKAYDIQSIMYGLQGKDWWGR
jgi:hypothetical protein